MRVLFNGNCFQSQYFQAIILLDLGTTLQMLTGLHVN